VKRRAANEPPPLHSFGLQSGGTEPFGFRLAPVQTRYGKDGLTVRYFLGVDAGATKTYAIVGDETGRILALGKGGPGNHQSREGLTGAMASYAAAVDGALGAAGVTAADVAHGALCLAGADYPSDYVLLTEGISARWPALRFSVHNDSFAGLRAGTDRRWGVVSICGTGTNQVGIGKDGRELQVGGMGSIYGDFGGAADVGREAIRVSFLADEQRGPATSLVGIVLEHLGFGSMAELSYALYKGTYDRALVPRLAPKVFAAANLGDEAAQEILVRMGTALGNSVGGVICQLDLAQDDVQVVMAGSTWKGESPLMIDAFRLAVHRVAPRAKLVRPRYEPVVGAWLLAMEQVGVEVSGAVYAALEQTMPLELGIQERTADERG
jgi:N-acetylglucosamine kinase-like BadF-type ATPase